MITLKEFQDLVFDAADKYAEDCVFNPEDHQDAVEAIATDFVEGANWAYQLLTSKENA